MKSTDGFHGRKFTLPEPVTKSVKLDLLGCTRRFEKDPPLSKYAQAGLLTSARTDPGPLSSHCCCLNYGASRGSPSSRSAITSQTTLALSCVRLGCRGVSGAVCLASGGYDSICGATSANRTAWPCGACGRWRHVTAGGGPPGAVAGCQYAYETSIPGTRRAAGPGERITSQSR